MCMQIFQNPDAFEPKHVVSGKLTVFRCGIDI